MAMYGYPCLHVRRRDDFTVELRGDQSARWLSIYCRDPGKGEAGEVFEFTIFGDDEAHLMEIAGTFSLAALPRAHWTREDFDEAGYRWVLYAADGRGAVKLDEYPSEEEAEAEVAHLNANRAELQDCIEQARNKTGPWAPRGNRSEAAG